MPISKELLQKMDFYEQVYYALDEPVPFKGGLKCYPVTVKDYYNFYNCLPCLTMDKSVKIATDKDGNILYDNFGVPKKVTDIKGLGQNYLSYLIDKMKDEKEGPYITAQVMGLFELIFHINKGLYCPECGKEISYQEAMKGIDDFVNAEKEKVFKLYNDALDAHEEETGVKVETREIPKELMERIEQKARFDFFAQMQKCECGANLRDVFSIKTANGVNTLMVKDVEITSADFEELQALIPRQNILDYDGDKYVDPELKAELDLKAKLQNKDYTSPTLEKQLVCVSIGTGFSFDYLKSITIRKLGLLLRNIDRKETYYAQLQASMSGMVEFKTPPQHWIFTDDKKNIKDELTSYDDFAKKFNPVT